MLDQVISVCTKHPIRKIPLYVKIVITIMIIKAFSHQNDTSYDARSEIEKASREN